MGKIGANVWTFCKFSLLCIVNTICTTSVGIIISYVLTITLISISAEL